VTICIRAARRSAANSASSVIVSVSTSASCSTESGTDRLSTTPSNVYLATEQRLGRLWAGTDPAAGAALLIGGCFHHAFLNAFAGTDIDASRARRIAASLTEALLGGLGVDDVGSSSPHPRTRPAEGPSSKRGAPRSRS
jgi:hypothetical protein